MRKRIAYELKTLSRAYRTVCIEMKSKRRIEETHRQIFQNKEVRFDLSKNYVNRNGRDEYLRYF